MSDPAYRLTQYQSRFGRDPHRVRSIDKARRVGGTFASSFGGVLGSCGLELTADGIAESRIGGEHLRVVSHSEDAAIRVLAECVTILERLSSTGVVPPQSRIASVASTKVVLASGIELTAHSSRAASLRGLSGSVILDEWAFAPTPEETWRAVKAVSDATLARPAARITICTTPWVRQSLAWEQCVGDATLDRFGFISRFHWPLSMATLQGYPRKFDTEAERLEFIEDTRATVGDDAAYAQEYECDWSDPSSQWLNFEALRAAQWDELPSGDFVEFAGVDIGRKRHATAIATVRVYTKHTSEGPSHAFYVMPVTLMRNAPFAEQEEAFIRTIDSGVRKLVGDATGVGSAPLERLQSLRPGRVEPVVFSVPVKEAMASTFKLALDSKVVWLPEQPETLRSLSSIRREAMNGGAYRYDAPGSGSDHADAAWAILLAFQAATKSVHTGGVGILTSGRSSPAAAMRDALIGARPERRPAGYPEPGIRTTTTAHSYEPQRGGRGGWNMR